MAKTGRPKLARGKQKDATLSVRVTYAEKRALGAVARTARTKLSTWARTTLLAAIGVV